MPPWGVLIAFVVAAICTRWCEAVYDGVKLSVVAQKGHIAVGGVCLIVCLLSWCVPRLHNRTPAVSLMIVKLRIRASSVFQDCCDVTATVVAFPFTFDMRCGLS